MKKEIREVKGSLTFVELGLSDAAELRQVMAPIKEYKDGVDAANAHEEWRIKKKKWEETHDVDDHGNMIHPFEEPEPELLNVPYPTEIVESAVLLYQFVDYLIKDIPEHKSMFERDDAGNITFVNPDEG